MFCGGIVDICYKYDRHQDGMIVEEFHKKALNILKYVEQRRDAEDKLMI